MGKYVKIDWLILIVMLVDCYILLTFCSLFYKSRIWPLANVDKFGSRSKLVVAFTALLVFFVNFLQIAIF